MSAANRTDVLIFTFSDVERRSVLHAFERAMQHKASPVSIGDRMYRDLGSFQGKRIFLALSEIDTWRSRDVQREVQRGIVALTPAAVVTVGIAFGLNQQKQKLGDIIISNRLLLNDRARARRSQPASFRGERLQGSAWLLDYFKSSEMEWKGAKVRFGILLAGDSRDDDINYRDQLQSLGQEIIGEVRGCTEIFLACQAAKAEWVSVSAIGDWADGSNAGYEDAIRQHAADSSAAFVVHSLQHAALNHSGSILQNDKMQDASCLTDRNQQIGSILVNGSGNSIAIQQGTVTSLPGGPSAHSAFQQNRALEIRQQPTRFSIRKLLHEVFRTHADLVAFCIDYFPPIAHRFSHSMDRVECENILLQLAETDEILTSLRSYNRVAVDRYSV